MIKFNIIFILAIIGFANSLYADTIYLKNGQTMQGKVVGQTRKTIRLRLGNGNIRTITKTSVNRIKYNATTKADSKEAEQRRRTQQRLEKIKAEQLRQQIERRKQKTVTKRPQTISTTPLDLLWRSALIPGWGQYHNGHKLKGALWLTAFVGSGIYVVNQTNHFIAARDKTNANNYTWNILSLSGNRNIVAYNIIQRKTAFETVSDATTSSRAANMLFVSIYVFNLLDAWLFSDGSTKPALNEIKNLDQKSAGFWIHTDLLSAHKTSKQRQVKIGYLFRF